MSAEDAAPDTVSAALDEAIEVARRMFVDGESIAACVTAAERIIRDAERENLLLDWDLGEPEEAEVEAGTQA